MTTTSELPPAGPRPWRARLRRGLARVLPVGLVMLAGLVIVAPRPGIAAAHDPGAVEPDGYVSFEPVDGGFTLAASGRAAPLVVDDGDYPGVVRVVGDLADDIARVTGARPDVSAGVPTDRAGGGAGDVVLVGTLGHSPLIDGLVAAGKLDVSAVAGRWETSLQQVVDAPMAGVGRALVIAGSDQRGTVYGAYDVSRRIGVSPWYWWDDVPARQHDALYVRPGAHSQGTPAVRYRGVFINDENPQTGTWAPRLFGDGEAPCCPGGLNHRYYEKVFELMLRLKANYLWPAVWGRAFALDDPDNQATATRYGIVVGTSHEAPMMRGIEEWNRDPNAYGGTGEWSFVRNPEAVRAYWRDGIVRMRRQGSEGVVTLGMRGNGDTSLPDGDGVALMQQIIAAQRQILTEEGGRPVTEIPQVWTLYKEVQRYWDRGLRPPDDVTVTFTDDNWGNLRRLPDASLPARSGGYGMYYHFDYVGGGRSYKWVDTANLANTWEQLHTAYSYGVDRLWVANVGDLKNSERATQFYLDYAWDPAAWPAARIPDWERGYAAQNFPAAAADEVAALLHRYGQLQGLRKPESTNRRYTRNANGSVTNDDAATPFSIENYAELDRVTADWQELAARARRLAGTLPPADSDAFTELVGYPVEATANLYALRRAQFLNRWYAAQGRAVTNEYADLAQARLADDQALSEHYNTALAGGKWQGWQTQTKIGYGDKARYGPDASWSEPPAPDQLYPAVQRITVPAAAELGVAVDGSRDFWPGSTAVPALPTFSRHQTRPAQYLEVFDRGSTAFDYRIESPVPWLTASPAAGTVTGQVRATLAVDFSAAPPGLSRVPVTVTGAGRSVTVQATVDNPAAPTSPGFVDAGGYVAMEADHFSAAVSGNGVSWQRIADIGRTGSGMQATPVTAPDQAPGGDGPRLEYRLNLAAAGRVTVWAYLSPRNDVRSGAGVRYAVSLDDQAPKTVDVTAATGADATAMNKGWELNTTDAVNRTSTTFMVPAAGPHTLRFWVVDPTVVLQRLVVDTGGLADSYLGPPESYRVPQALPPAGGYRPPTGGS